MNKMEKMTVSVKVTTGLKSVRVNLTCTKTWQMISSAETVSKVESIG